MTRERTEPAPKDRPEPSTTLPGELDYRNGSNDEREVEGHRSP